MIPTPTPPDTPLLAALARWDRVRLSGRTGVAVPLPWAPVPGYEGVYRNGLLVDPATYTLDGPTLTLATALTAGDVLIVCGWHR